jgi:enoyl-CoA hydratase
MAFTPDFSTLDYEERNGVAYVTLNRPDRHNAFNSLMQRELRELWRGLRRHDDVRCVVLTGAGEKAFCAGADIGHMRTAGALEARAFAERGHQIADLIEGLGTPVVAAVNGFALGGGLELAMACTFRLASENARLGQPEIKLGIIPGYGGTQRLPRLVGKGTALALLLTGDPIPAAEAYRIGLVQQVVPQAELLATARQWVARILANGPLAAGLLLEAVQLGFEMPLEEAMAFEAAQFGLSCSTQDMREGTRAFLEKRPAQFRGR